MAIDATEHSNGARRGEKVNQLFEELKASILQGRYAPGQRLIEADLTRDHGVSRGPLREAFRQLAAEGLVDIVPNKGTTVRRLSRKEMADLFLIRQSLEGLAASLAASNMNRRDYKARFAAAVKAIKSLRKIKTPESFAEENTLLHQIIVELSDNPQLAILVNQLQLPLARFQIRQAVNQSYRDHSAREHDRIIDAVLAGNRAQAETAMRQHLQRAAKQVAFLDDSTFVP